MFIQLKMNEQEQHVSKMEIKNSNHSGFKLGGCYKEEQSFCEYPATLQVMPLPSKLILK